MEMEKERAVAELEPHQSAWLAAAQRADPAFAAMVRYTLHCEGHADICTICGDVPLGDFRVIEALVTPRGVPTLRLCGGCFAVQSVAEMLVPITPAGKGVALRLLQDGTAALAGFWKKIYTRRF